MAGESPDRSEREKSSGETREESAPVPSARRRPGEPPASTARAGAVDGAADEAEGASAPAGDSGDAGESADREPEAAETSADSGDSGDARLRAAVAAWVSGSASDRETAPESNAEDAAGSGQASGGPAGDDASAAGAAGQLPVRPRPSAPETAAGPAADRPDEDPPTTLFGGVRREDPESGEDAAAARAERMTAAFFGASRSRDGAEQGAAEEPAEPAEESADPAARQPADEPAEQPDPEPDPESAAAEAVDGADAPDTPDEPAEGDRAAAAEDSDGPRDQATSVLRAPAGPSADGPVDSPTTHLRPPEPGETDTPDAPQGERTGEDTRPAGKNSPAPEGRHPGAAAARERLAKGAAGARSAAAGFVPLRDPDEAERSGAAEPSAGAPEAGPTGVGGGLERTKQQPLPDPPPLELLAQLTNTPAPPATPLRTALRRVKIWTPLVVLLGIVFVVAQALRPLPEPSLTLTAAPAHTFDGGRPSLPWPGEGQAEVQVAGIGTLGTHGEQKPVPIGSVAKTMTAYLVLREHPLEEGEDGPTLTIDKQAEEGGKRGAGNGNESVLDGVKAGDRISLRQALSALMIPSANNIARLLARWDSGSEEAFVGKMNRTADELGMDRTTYTDPSGLRESTVSTAGDQVKLGAEVVEMPELMSITKLPSWKNPFTGQQMRNYNTLVPYDGAIGIKTGTTTAAGGNLLFAGHKDVGGTRQLIVGAVLGQHAAPIIDTVNAVSRELLTAAGDTLTSETIVRKGDVVGHLDDGLGGLTPVVATEDVRAVGYPGVRVDLSLEPGGKAMPHAAPAGKEVGVLQVGDGPGAVEVPVALQKRLTEPPFADRLTHLL
ncbi:D-alanyl-D-alanine carboxypeptidase [Streptomyces sp. TR02-1]|uniref:D-alanyl-D-alanine carboxypeptidase n=1 Tax=Streptomyces sp. TR02-1 TaxID=3385977 RepID=UPI0039A1FEFE